MGIGQGIPLQTVAYDCSNHLTNVRFEHDYRVSLDVSLIVLISSNSVMLLAVHVIPRGFDEAKINLTCITVLYSKFIGENVHCRYTCIVPQSNL